MLRIGILIENEKVPAWVDEAIQEINLFKNIQWAFLIQHQHKTYSGEKWPFKIFKKLDSTLLPGKPNLAAKINLRLPEQVSLINIQSASAAISKGELEKISSYKADVILHFGSDTPCKEILNLPNQGVWSIRFGSQKSTDESAGFWEWLHQLPTTEVSLGRIKDELSNFECIANGSIKTEYLSLSRNQTALFSKAIDLLVNNISRLSLTEKLNEVTGRLKSVERAEVKVPNLGASFLASWKLILRAVTKFLRKKFFIEQWVLFYSFSPNEFPKLNFQKFTELAPPKDRIWADPFGVSENGKHYVFVEELMLETNKGHLSCLVLNQAGEIETSQIIIDKPYHLSYPQIFQHKSVWYLIPESGENKTVDLFECTSFPFQWKFKQSLLTNVEAYDTTIHFHDGKFWLFCTIKKREGASTDDDLYLFYADDFLTNNWRPHPKNPVLSDPSVARPAGRIFVHQNNLYRPSQIGVPRYGYGLALNKIIELSESDYKEETLSRALPTWRKDLLSVHTLNFTESITVIDGQLKRFKF